MDYWILVVVRLKLSVKPDMECGGKRSATPLWIDALAR